MGNFICFLRRRGSWEGCWCAGGAGERPTALAPRGSRLPRSWSCFPSPSPGIWVPVAPKELELFPLPHLQDPGASVPPAPLCAPGAAELTSGWFLQPRTQGISRTRDFNYLGFLLGGHEPVSPLN